MGRDRACPTRGEKTDIILIDDDPAFCHTLKYSAKKRGLDIDCFTSLMEMGSIANFNKYRVAIVDYELEQMNGIEVAEYFPVFFQDTPVILISATYRTKPGADRDPRWPASIRQFVHKDRGADAIIDTALAWSYAGKHAANGTKSGGAEVSKHLDPGVVKDLLEMEMDDEGFLVQLYQAFIGASEHAIKDIHAALAGFDCRTIMRLAHKLKGSAHNVGAERLAEHCGRLEVHANHRNLTLVYTLLKEIEREWSTVVQGLKKSLLLRAV